MMCTIYYDPSVAYKYTVFRKKDPFFLRNTVYL